jgi:hypothetical protein
MSEPEVDLDSIIDRLLDGSSLLPSELLHQPRLLTFSHVPLFRLSSWQ